MGADEVLDLSTPRRLHLVGVGGPGMNPIAAVLAAQGHHVSGSDLKDSAGLTRLRSLGVEVTVGHDPALVEGVDAVIASTAIPERNIELAAARQAGIPVLHGEHVHYSGSPELMADYVKLALDSGARIVGGCCGNSPAHVKAMRDAMDGYKRGARPTVDEIVSKLGALVSPPNENAGERRRGGRRGR